MTDWPIEFDAVLRENLPNLGAGDPLRGDVGLADYGLDSMGTVTLLVDLEKALNIQFPDEMLVPETFETADQLWKQARSLLTG